MKRVLLLLFLLVTISACKKGKGAICNDGTRSYSTGQGTCSWHKGVKYYVDPDEISIGNTIVLVASLGFAGYLLVINRKKD